MINIAKLLEDAPEGIKLYSPLFGEVGFKYVEVGNIIVKDKYGFNRIFSKDGKYFMDYDSECLLFPSKDYRTWQGWTPCVEPNFEVGDWVVRKDGETFYGGNYAEQITLIEVDEKGKCIWLSSTSWVNDDDIRLWTIQDAKDGDVLVTTKIRSCPFIYRKTAYPNDFAYYYAGIDGNGNFCEGCLKRTLAHFGPVASVAPATKEQRDLLFNKIKEAGYEWDEKKKELRKIQPHYNIANFYAGMPVLVREYDTCVWQWVQYSHFNGVGLFFAAGKTWRQCIPFNEDTKHLLGTTDMPSEEYINW